MDRYSGYFHFNLRKLCRKDCAYHYRRNGLVMRQHQPPWHFFWQDCVSCGTTSDPFLSKLKKSAFLSHPVTFFVYCLLFVFINWTKCSLCPVCECECFIFILTRLCHLVQSDHGVRGLLVTGKRTRASFIDNWLLTYLSAIHYKLSSIEQNFPEAIISA